MPPRMRTYLYLGIFIVLMCGSLQTLPAQAKNDIDASDAAAFQQKLGLPRVYI